MVHVLRWCINCLTVSKKWVGFFAWWIFLSSQCREFWRKPNLLSALIVLKFSTPRLSLLRKFRVCGVEWWSLLWRFSYRQCCVMVGVFLSVTTGAYKMFYFIIVCFTTALGTSSVTNSFHHWIRVGMPSTWCHSWQEPNDIFSPSSKVGWFRYIWLFHSTY